MRIIRVLRAVRTVTPRKTRKDRADNTSIRTVAMVLLTSCAYSAEAIARKVRGKEYAHHATLNFLIDFLKSAGLQACSGSNKKVMKKPKGKLYDIWFLYEPFVYNTGINLVGHHAPPECIHEYIYIYIHFCIFGF